MSRKIVRMLGKEMHWRISKEVRDGLNNIYEEDEKIKKAKLQTYRGRFESLKMEEEEYVATFLLWVDEIVNTIRGLGEEMK